MNVLVVFCHPEKRSFNASLKDIAIEHFNALGYTTECSDLYADKFDPVEKAEHYTSRICLEEFSPLAEQRHSWNESALHPDVVREIDRLKKADLVIFQFPIWWHSIPAMLKGYMDRVFISGGLYTSKMRYDKGYFHGKRTLCSVTSGAPEQTFRSGGRAGGEIETLLWTTNFSLHYMGFSVLRPHFTPGIQGHGYKYENDVDFELAQMNKLDQWRDCLSDIENRDELVFPGWSDWES